MVVDCKENNIIHTYRVILMIWIFSLMSIVVYAYSEINKEPPNTPRRQRPPWYIPGEKKISRKAKGWNKRPKEYNYHYFSTSVTGGYSLFTNASKGVQLIGLAGGAYGIGYELRVPSKNFWFNISPEIQILGSSVGLHYSIYDRWINDSEGRLAIYHYDMLKGTDRQMAVSSSVPLLFGYYDKNFYVGVGVKAGYFFYGRGYDHLDYKTHATYDRYIDEYEDMPNHYYTFYNTENERKMKFNRMTLGMCFEIGSDVMLVEKKKKGYWRFQYHNLDWKYILKLAFYAEYGIMDINGHEEAGTVWAYDENNPINLTVQPFYATLSPTDLSLRPFYAGVKLTFLFTVFCDRCNGKAKVF